MVDTDIFDRIMSLPVLRIFEPFYRRYREQLLYLFFGGLAFLVNVGCYALAGLFMHHLAANVIAWIAGVLFAYVTNRGIVFGSTVNTRSGIAKELIAFSGGRLATLGLEELILWVGIDLLGGSNMVVKILAQVAVLIGNYALSKWFVFRKSK